MLSALFSWPGINRRALSFMLPDGAPRRARALDGRFVRPLRALGHTLVTADEPAELVCASLAPADGDPITLLRRLTAGVPAGGVVVVRSALASRERLAAAFLHAGLRDVEQTRIGRGFLTAGVIAVAAPDPI